MKARSITHAAAGVAAGIAAGIAVTAAAAAAPAAAGRKAPACQYAPLAGGVRRLTTDGRESLRALAARYGEDPAGVLANTAECNPGWQPETALPFVRYVDRGRWSRIMPRGAWVWVLRDGQAGAGRP
jgi:hypothetical protein